MMYGRLGAFLHSKEVKVVDGQSRCAAKASVLPKLFADAPQRKVEENDVELGARTPLETGLPKCASGSVSFRHKLDAFLGGIS